jgi:hypothetical protein
VIRETVLQTPRLSSKSRRGFTVRRISLLSLLAVPLAFVACASSAATTAFTPITGVLVRSDSLVTGHGCGTADTQVFKYAIVLTTPDHLASAKIVSTSASSSDSQTYYPAAIQDCFSDAEFRGLPTTDYGLIVYAYNARDYAAVASSLPNPPNPQTDYFDTFGKAPHTWSTTCTATQQANIEVLAVCQPLNAGAAAK